MEVRRLHQIYPDVRRFPKGNDTEHGQEAQKEQGAQKVYKTVGRVLAPSRYKLCR